MASEQNKSSVLSAAGRKLDAVLPTAEKQPKVQRVKAEKAKAPKQQRSKSPRTSMSSPDKLQILFTVVNREKTEFYIDLLHNFEINLQLVLNGHGTASPSVRTLLGLTELEKSVIVSVVRKDRAKDALAALEEKFSTVKNGKGVAYTVPMSSVIGVAIYQFISNKKNGGMI